MSAKIALVTGGSRGLGKDMAISIARKGIDVILTYRNNEQQALEVVAVIESMGCKATALHLDMSNINSLDAFMQSVTKILNSKWDTAHFDFLINNAGMGATVPFADVTEALFDDFMNVHFKGVYFLTQKSLPLLNNGGRVVNILTATTRLCVSSYSGYASITVAVETST